MRQRKLVHGTVPDLSEEFRTTLSKVLQRSLHERHGGLRNLSIDVQPRGMGAVNTLYVFKQNVTKFRSRLVSPEGLVLNEDGQPSPIVHNMCPGCRFNIENLELNLTRRNAITVVRVVSR